MSSKLSLELSTNGLPTKKITAKKTSTKSLRVRLLSLAVLITLVATACSSGSTTASPDDAPEDSVDTEDSGVIEDSALPDDAAAPDDSAQGGLGSTQAVGRPTGPPTLAPSGCQFNVLDGFEAECGFVLVPEVWEDESDPEAISLHVATFTNDQTPEDATPVVYLEGGPGGDVFFGLEFNLEEQWGELINNHPLVVFTQRGSSLSDIDLECEEVLAESVSALERVPDSEADFEGQIGALSRCANRLLAEGADLSAYNTLASANDADAVRQALGIESWNVFGISYGTRLGQELARTHPDAIEALVLDSVQPTDPALGSLAAVPSTYQAALNRFFEGCEADTGCAELHPDLENRLFGVFEQAATEPFVVDGIDPVSGGSFEAIIDDARLSGVVFNALYAPTLFASVPQMIAELEAGETTTLSSFIGLQILNSGSISNGQFTAVICHDYTAELTPASAYDDGATGDPFFDEVFLGADPAAGAAETCDAFPAGSADVSVTEPVESDIPTLLLSGEYDPITPASNAEAVAAGFSNGQTVVLPDEGHAVTTSECGLAIAIDFLAEPSAEANSSCIESSPAPPFVAPSLEGTVLVPFTEPLLGLTGVAPEGWVDQGFGTTVRDDVNLADQLVLLQQAVPAPVDEFIGLFEGQLNTEVVETGEETFGDRTWQMFEAESLLGEVLLWVNDESGSTIAVGLVGNSATFDDAREHIIEEVLTTITAS